MDADRSGDAPAALALLGECDQRPGPGLLGFPGPTLETAAICRVLLQEIHVSYRHPIIDADPDLSHSLLAIYSLGAPSDLLKTCFDLHSRRHHPLEAATVDITEVNWTSHLGQTEHYASYLSFFYERVKQLGGPAAIGRFIFDASPQEMLARLLDTAFQPLLHLGYGIEFGLDAVVAEALARTAVHASGASGLFPNRWPDRDQPSVLKTYTRKLSVSLKSKSGDSFVTTARSLPRGQRRGPKIGLSAFTVLSSMLADDDLAPGIAHDRGENPHDGAHQLALVIKNRGRHIRRWAAEWVCTVDGGWTEIVEKTEELFWLATLLLFATSRPNRPTRLDFYLMRAFVCMLTLPAVLEILSPADRVVMLQTYFTALLAYWVSRGRPELYIPELLSCTTQPGPGDSASVGAKEGAIARALCEASTTAPDHNAAQEGAPGSTESTDNAKEDDGSVRRNSRTKNGASVNPWLTVMMSAVDHPDPHLPQVVRTLAFGGRLFGLSPPGMFACGLRGTDILDGSLFIRAAGVAMDTLGWVRDTEEEAGDWDRSGLGFDEAWDSKGKGKA